jgi:hypothetical protein
VIAKIQKYFEGCRRRAELLAEARELLAALEHPAATVHIWVLMELLLEIGVGHLQAAKKTRDVVNAAVEMDRRIREGQRPSYSEAGLN